MLSGFSVSRIRILAATDLLSVQIAGIGVAFVAGATVTDNTVINPVAGISDTSGPYDKPFADPAAIYFDCVSGGITVTNNKFESINALLVGQAWNFPMSQLMFHICPSLYERE